MEKGGDKMIDSIINETKVVPRNIVEYKKINPDYQIPLIYDRPFKAVCKTYKEFINKILIELLDINPKSIEASYFVDAELPLEQHSSKKMITDLLLHVIFLLMSKLIQVSPRVMLLKVLTMLFVLL